MTTIELNATKTFFTLMFIAVLMLAMYVCGGAMANKYKYEPLPPAHIQPVQAVTTQAAVE